jgi:hypothetical protein
MCETLSAFIAAHCAGYVDSDQLAWVREVEAEAEKSLNGYINFVRQQGQGSAEYGRQWVHEAVPEYTVPISDDATTDEAP